MKQIWFTSDHHYFHRKVLEYRPFKSAEEMNEALIDNWNNCVNHNDEVYFLGDFALASRTKTLEIRNKLKGKISVVEGNHDKSLRQIKDTFKSYQNYLKTTIQHKGKDYNLILFHYPLLSWQGMWSGSIMLHAHSHNGMTKFINEHLPNSRILDIGVDSVASILSKDEIRKPQDYRPISIEEIDFLLKDKTGPCKNLQ